MTVRGDFPAPTAAPRWLKRGAIAVLLVLAVLVIAGTVYQAVGERADARNYPPPGELVSVGPHRLHLHCMGEGSPTVILEALAGGTSSYWAWVQPEVARTTRVCAYDRVGRGWSDPGAAPADLWGTVDNLHTLLQNAGVDGPYVLVGHSIGGLYARGFAHRFADEVAALVLLDSAHPEQLARYPEYQEEQRANSRLTSIFPALARIGLFRLYFATGGEIDFQDLPARQHAEVAALWSSPAYFHNQRAESALAGTLYAQAQELRPLGDLPLMVISAGESRESWATLQAELAALSSRSQHVTVEGATHVSLAFNPEHARETSQGIAEMVEAVRAGE